jgi:hypothetical protein
MTSSVGSTNVRDVRVVIEFTGSGRWMGTLRCEPSPAVDTPFEGRLGLLRLLETLVDQRHTTITTTAPADEKGEQRP